METKLNIAEIKIDLEIQSRAFMDVRTVQDYSERMAEGDVFPPVTVFYDGTDYWLADGFHRIEAIKSFPDRKEIDCEVWEGPRLAAIDFSLQANKGHGLKRSEGDKKTCG